MTQLRTSGFSRHSGKHNRRSMSAALFITGIVKVLYILVIRNGESKVTVEGNDARINKRQQKTTRWIYDY